MKSSIVAGAARSRSTGSVLQQALACTFFAAIVAVCARIAIPLPYTPVPITLQPLAIMLTGLFLGSRLGFLSLVEYLVAGALGAPVFAGGTGGLAYLAAVSTLGYLLSYPFAAFAVGKIAETGRSSFTRLFLACVAGIAVIYLGGNLYLAYWLRKGPLQTLLAGAGYFIAFDLVKAVIAAGVASTTAPRWFSFRGR